MGYSSTPTTPILTPMTSTLPPLVQAFSGAIGSASAKALVYPLDLVTTKLQLDPPNKPKKSRGIRGAIRILLHITKTRGINALYDGIVTDASATLLSNFFYFYIYSFLRSLSARRLISIPSFSPQKRMAMTSRNSPHKPTLFEEVLLGFLAGVASRAISTPLNIITVKLQNARDDEEESGVEEPNQATVSSIAKLIHKEQGLAGFWRGFKMTTILSLNPSITLAFFQIFRKILSFTRSPIPSAPNSSLLKTAKNIKLAHPAAIRKAPSVNPTPREAFLGGAISNSIAVAILYPLILVKTRLQASSSSSMQQLLLDAYLGKDSLVETHSHDKEKEVERSQTPGILGLYQGLEMQIMKGFLNQGVTLLVKGRIEEMIVAAYKRSTRK